MASAGRPAPFHLMAEMRFDRGPISTTALASEAGRESGRDLRNFAQAGVDRCSSPMTTRHRWLSRAPRFPVDPATLDFERVRYAKDAGSGVATVTIDRPAGPQRLRLPDAARARPRLRGRVVGRRDRGGGGDRGRGASLLHGRRPRRAGRHGRHQRPVLALDGRIHRDARPAAQHRQADHRAHQRRLRRRRERAPDGLRSLGAGRRRVHPPRRARARLRAGRRRDAVAADPGR